MLFVYLQTHRCCLHLPKAVRNTLTMDCVQVLQWVMSYDNENATEALAITAASAALAVSGLSHVAMHEHSTTPQHSGLHATLPHIPREGCYAWGQ